MVGSSSTSRPTFPRERRSSSSRSMTISTKRIAAAFTKRSPHRNRTSPPAAIVRHAIFWPSCAAETGEPLPGRHRRVRRSAGGRDRPLVGGKPPGCSRPVSRRASRGPRPPRRTSRSWDPLSSSSTTWHPARLAPRKSSPHLLHRPSRAGRGADPRCMARRARQPTAPCKRRSRRRVIRGSRGSRFQPMSPPAGRATARSVDSPGPCGHRGSLRRVRRALPMETAILRT